MYQIEDCNIIKTLEKNEDLIIYFRKPSSEIIITGVH